MTNWSSRSGTWRALALVGLFSACDVEPVKPGAVATFGVLYGGQIQQKREIPFELDPARQTQAFRVTLDAPAPSPLRVAWELSKPGRGGRKPTTKLEEAHLATGETLFERTLPFAPGDPTGLWNLRVVLTLPDGRETLVLDRPFEVYDAVARKELLRLRDAGLP